jgi:hypothetical protein
MMGMGGWNTRCFERYTRLGDDDELAGHKS